MPDGHASIKRIMDEHLGSTFPACALCVMHRGSSVLNDAWGWIDAETRRIRATPETLFDLASLTKLFTATAFLAMSSAGHISPSMPLVSIVPEFGLLNPRPVDGGQDPHTKQHLATPPDLIGQTIDPAEVTFRHLLTHTGGLPPWRDVYNAAGPPPADPDHVETIPRPERWRRGLDALVRYAFVGKPNGIVRYSDIGLMLLGEAVARLHAAAVATAEGQVDFALALQSWVLGKMDRRDLVFNPVRDHGIPRHDIAPTEMDSTWRLRRVWGEVHDENACGVGGVAGHAGLFGTAHAAAVFGSYWLTHAGAKFGLAPAIAEAAVRLQAESEGQRRGLGWALKAAVDSSAGDIMGGRTFGHTGFTGTSLWIDPDAGLVIALLTNSVYLGRHSRGYDRTHAFRRAIHDAVARHYSW